jgi:hypothetical protein
MRFKVGEKVWVYVAATWVEAVIVSQPVGLEAKRGTVFVQIDDDKDVYRYIKKLVRKF